MIAAERVFAETRLLGVPSEADRYMLSGVLIEGIATTIPQRIPAQNGDNFRRQLRLHWFPWPLRIWFGSRDGRRLMPNVPVRRIVLRETWKPGSRFARPWLPRDARHP